MLNSKETAAKLVEIAEIKAENRFFKTVVLAFLAGMFIAFGGAIANTAAFSVQNVSIQRLLTGATFALGLPMTILCGAELVTGNCLMVSGLLCKRISAAKLLRNWGIVYFGNFLGALTVALLVVLSGQLNYGDSTLAAYTIKVANAKVTASLSHNLISGILCNILVCCGVFMATAAKDAIGKIVASFMPVFVFVTLGFEHSIANMYFCTAGLIAKLNPIYADKAVEMGVNFANLTWGNFLFSHLPLVTAGNIIGGCCLGVFFVWYSNIKCDG